MGHPGGGGFGRAMDSGAGQLFRMPIGQPLTLDLISLSVKWVLGTLQL